MVGVGRDVADRLCELVDRVSERLVRLELGCKCNRVKSVAFDYLYFLGETLA